MKCSKTTIMSTKCVNTEIIGDFEFIQYLTSIIWAEICKYHIVMPASLHEHGTTIRSFLYFGSQHLSKLFDNNYIWSEQI